MTEKMQRYEDKHPELAQEHPWTTPAVDIFENENELYLLADVPGVRKDNLSIHLDRQQLSIVGRVDDQSIGQPLSREYQPLDYRRSFVLPAGIDGDKISAELDHGVLKLHLPKSEAVKSRQISVKAG